jgi:phospholipid/cholesterol/gamma-HCH transport system substrate-binding protein
MKGADSMPSRYTPALKVGLFVLIVSAVLVLALVLMGGIRVSRNMHEYFVETDEAVDGIDVNSIVTLQGVEIGRVRAIELDHSTFASVRIRIEIDPDVVIPDGSQAYFERLGLTGERAIDIGGGSLSDGRIPPGGEIPRGQTEFEQLSARAEPLADELEEVLAALHTTIRAAEQRVAAVDPEQLAAIIGAVDPQRVGATVIAAERASERLARAAARLPGTLDEARLGIAAVRSNVDDVADRAEQTLGHANAGLDRLACTIGHVDEVVVANRRDLRMTLHNLRRASEQANALLDALQNDPSALLRRPRRPRNRR